MTGIPLRVLIVSVVGMSLVPTKLVAQEAVDSSRVVADGMTPDSLHSLFRAAEQERGYVRLTMPGQVSYAGYVFDVEPDSGWVHIGARRATVSAIDRVELRHKEESGAFIGSVLGAALFAWAGYNYERDCDVPCPDGDFVCDRPCIGGWPISIAGGLLGGIVGSLAGMVVDPGVTHWQEVWRDEP